ncbi:hypothetical protein H9P43_004406 [Blastocladiella emersonii ATCC 22665]|nr:hypothetical protein H9P43_004406 [Blastocladiella emersonii ATCC 22665]
MGKVPTKKRASKQRHNPTGLVSHAELQRDMDTMMDEVEPETEPTPEAVTAAIPLLNKLTAPDAGDRVWAAAGVANLVSDPANRKALLSKGLIDLLVSQVQTETHPEVLLEVTGAARNLVTADPSVANELGRKGVLVGLEAILVQCRNLVEAIFTDTPAANAEEEDMRRAVNPLISNVFTLINALCVASKSAIRAATQAPQTLPFLQDVIRAASKFPLPVVTSGMALLEIMTEDNTPAHRAIGDDVIDALPSFLHHADAAVAVSAAGTLYNLRSRATSEQWIRHILVFMHHHLGDAASTLCADATAYLHGAPAARTDDAEMEVENNEQAKETVQVEGVVDKRYDALAARVATTSAALELLANLTSQVVEPGANDSDEWMDDDEFEAADNAAANEDNEDDDDDEEVDAAVVELAEEVGTNELAAELNADDAALVQIVESTRSKLQHEFALSLPLLVAIARTTSVALPTDPSATVTSNMRELVAAVQTVRVRSLAVLNNLFFAVLALPVKKRAGHPFPLLNLIMTPGTAAVAPRALTQSLYEDFAAILQDLATSSSVTAAEHAALASELLAMTLGAIWGLTKNFDTPSDLGAASWVAIPQSAVEALVQLYYSPLSSTADEEPRVKLVGLLGVIGKRQPGHVAANAAIGAHLFALLRTPSTLPPAVLAEVLNAVFDIYGDKAYDYDAQVFRQAGALAVLQAAVDGVKTVVKGIDRRRNRALRDHCDEALVNLRGFIKYKQQEYRS